MLIVRQQQIETIIKGNGDDFVNYLVAHLKSNYSEAIAKRNEKRLREMVKTGIKRAASHDLTTVDETRFFVSKMFEIAPDFDTHPLIEAILTDRMLTPEKRVEKLRSPAISEEIWEEAKNNGDESVWFPKRKKPKSLKSRE